VYLLFKLKLLFWEFPFVDTLIHTHVLNMDTLLVQEKTGVVDQTVMHARKPFMK